MRENFRCVVIHVKHSTSSCVARYKAGADPSCRACPIGKEHAQGKTPTTWADGTPIERGIVVMPFDRIQSRRRRPRLHDVEPSEPRRPHHDNHQDQDP